MIFARLFQTASLILFTAFTLWAQTDLHTGGDSLPHITRDSLIDRLVQAHVRQNLRDNGVDGYRVQVYSGSGNEARQQANDIRRQLIASNPDLPTHLVYQPPNFKVRVGDCRTEFEAIRLKRELAFHYPQGFVVRDVIQLPRLAIESQATELEPDSTEGLFGEMPAED